MMLKEIRSGLSLLVVMTALCGFGYSFLVTGVAHNLFPKQAEGSLIKDGDKIIGSELIGLPVLKCQNYYFFLRPSLVDFNSKDKIIVSSASNLGQTSKDLVAIVNDRYKKLQAMNPESAVPADLLTASASGLDPEISLQAALFEAPIVAKMRKVETNQIVDLINKNAKNPILGIFGKPRVNVMTLNVELDKLLPIENKCK